MNKMRVVFWLMLSLYVSEGLANDAVLEPDTFLIRRGTAELKVADIDARLSRLTSGEAADLARRPQQFGSLMSRLLLNRQLANDARELGLDRDPKVLHDIQLAVEEVLSLHRLTHEVAQNTPDYELLAQERYQADPDKWGEPGLRRVRHVLVRSEGRTDEEALQLANNIHAQATAPDSDFAVLVYEYSEDPGKDSNYGSYDVHGDGSLAPEFETAALALTEVGQISEPVHTQFGYHILILDELVEPKRHPYDAVKAQIISELSDMHQAEARDLLRNRFMQMPEEADVDALRPLPNRYGALIPLPSAEN